MNCDLLPVKSVIAVNAVSMMHRLATAAIDRVEKDDSAGMAVKRYDAGVDKRFVLADIDLDSILMNTPSRGFHMETFGNIKKAVKKLAITKKMDFILRTSTVDEICPKLLGVNEVNKSYILSNDQESCKIYSEFSRHDSSTRHLSFTTSKPLITDSVHFDNHKQMWACSSAGLDFIENLKPFNCSITCYYRSKKALELKLFLFKMLNLFNDRCMWVQDYSKNRILFVSYQTMYHRGERLDIHVVMINPKTRKVLINRKFTEDRFCKFIKEGNEVNLEKRPFFKAHKKVLTGGFINDELFHGAVPGSKGTICCFLKYRESVGYLTDQYEMKQSTTYHLLPLTLNLLTRDSTISMIPSQVSKFSNLSLSYQTEVPLICDGEAVFRIISESTSSPTLLKILNLKGCLLAIAFNAFVCVWKKEHAVLYSIRRNCAIKLCLL